MKLLALCMAVPAAGAWTKGRPSLLFLLLAISRYFERASSGLQSLSQPFTHIH